MLYNQVGAGLGQGNNRLGGAIPTNNQQANAALAGYWQNRQHTEQYDWDVAAWYGAYMSPGDASIQACLAKVFTVLQIAGVRYDNGTVPGTYQWRDCADQGIPLGAILAHGGRLLIQLPVRTAHSNSGQDFFNWLTQEARTAGTCVSRTTATHALSNRAPSRLLEGERRFRIAEERGKTSGIRGAIKTKVFGEHNHWGVNLALFGSGRTNWFSGNTVDHLGGHGHLYMYFNSKDVGQCAGMMLGGENSGVGAMSQTFVGHGAKAVSEDFSPAGTYKWPAMNHGPNHMIEEFIVDLSDGWQHLMGQEAHFDPAHLDHTPAAASTALLQTDLLRLVIYAVTDMLEASLGNLGYWAKRRLEAHRDTLLNSNNLPRATISAILKECFEACGCTNVTINNNTGAIAGTALTMAVPRHMQTTITTIQSNWNFSV